MGFISKMIGKAIGKAAIITGIRAAGTGVEAIQNKLNKQKRTDLLDSLSNLQDLYDKGALTDKEYKKQKKHILNELKTL